MAPDAASVLVISSAVAVYAAVAVGDLRSRQIPNHLVLAVLALGFGRTILLRTMGDGLLDVGAAIAVFAIVLPLFAWGVIGGGDAKLIPASVLLIGHSDALAFAMDMALIGGGLSLVVLAMDVAKRRRSRRRRAPAERPSVPYGVAVASAAVLAIASPLYHATNG